MTISTALGDSHTSLLPWHITIEELLKVSQKPKAATEVSLLVHSLEEKSLPLPLPGGGCTLQRWQSLARLGAFDLNVGKLLESHFDALAIMAEAAVEPKPGLYAVWASKFEGRHLSAQKHGGIWHLSGDLAFASGIGSIDYALVPVVTEEGEQLFEIPESAIKATDHRPWQTPGMIQSDTAWISVDARLSDAALVADSGFYLERRGFWPGAIGVAALWLGGAQSLFSSWLAYSRSKAHEDPHDQAQRAQVYCGLKACSAYLEYLAPLIDDPSSPLDVLKIEALTFRHLVDKACSELLGYCLRATGPGLMIRDGEFSKGFLDLQIFLRQCHAERDLVHLSKDLDRTEFQGEWF